MIRATRRLEIDAAHRVTRHESKCRHVHGHRYAFEVAVVGPELDDAGRVIDFGAVKQLVGGWLDEHLDHGYICRSSDEVGQVLERLGHKVFRMDGEPTAENLAMLVGVMAQRLLPDPLTVMHVRCYETPNCWADWYFSGVVEEP